MRVTSSMYYENLYGSNNSKLSKELFDVNKQISSGLKIQYASEDVAIFSETMRLDNEVTVLGQIKQSVDNGYKISNQTDTVLGQFTDNITRMRTLLLQASNDTNDANSLDAIAKELRGVEKGLMDLANTSINGQFLFSGSAVDTKPISQDGVYHGNDAAMNAFVGSRNQQQYNVSGAELFLGDEPLTQREVTSNVVNKNLVDSNLPLTTDSTLRELMGDKDNDPLTINTDYFYIQGRQSDGSSFKSKIALSEDLKINDLLTEIGKAFGNSASLDIVTVSLNDAGQIVIKDKQKGSSQLDFHMVGAVDYSGGVAANVVLIDNLDVAGATTYPPAGNLYIKEFMKSNLNSVPGATTNIGGLMYDRTEFEKNGSKLSSNASQVLKGDNSFAKPSTLLSEVFDLSQGTAGTLDGTKLNLVGTNIANAGYDVTINLDSIGSTFTDNNSGIVYDIYNMETPRTATDADKMTYQQLMDVINMVLTDSLPQAAGTHVNPDATPMSADQEYDYALDMSVSLGNTSLSYDGKVEFGSNVAGAMSATIALYDATSGDFSATTGSVATFNINNALAIHDPKTDFFKSIDEIVAAVENHKSFPDASSGDLRSIGISNAIAKLDDLLDHVVRSHSTVGSNSNTLTNALERTQLLEVSTMSLRSSIIDTDVAESTLRLTQLSLNYEAMLSTVAKVSKLSLVNYL